MFQVVTPEEAYEIIAQYRPGGFNRRPDGVRESFVLDRDIISEEYVPGFHRSTVDGFAVKAADTYGCSDALPAIVPSVPILTGGPLPENCDGVVMLEYAEDLGDGSVMIMKPAAVGSNLIYKGDDVKPGDRILERGHVMRSCDVGALAALGIRAEDAAIRKVSDEELNSTCDPNPYKQEELSIQKIRVGIISTGDELVPVDQVPGYGQVRDVNSSMLAAYVSHCGAKPVSYGCLKDQPALLEKTLTQAVSECDLVLISGGSSVGMKDATEATINRVGEVLFHGIAMRPGKPTIFGVAKNGVPVWGLPGHPVAAYYVCELFVREMLMPGEKRPSVQAILKENVSANDGRALYTGVRFKAPEEPAVSAEGSTLLTAVPVHGKSGLITTLARSDGYICVPRNREGIPAGEEVTVWLFNI